MSLSMDWQNRVILSTASITDLPAFHASLRDLEASVTGAIFPVAHRWKALDLGNGGFFYQADGINGYTLKFPNPGNYVIDGNLNIDIVPVAGVYVERKTSAAYITTSVGGSGVLSSAEYSAISSKLLEMAVRLGIDSAALAGSISATDAQVGINTLHETVGPTGSLTDRSSRVNLLSETVTHYG